MFGLVKISTCVLSISFILNWIIDTHVWTSMARLSTDDLISRQFCRVSDLDDR